MEAIQAFETFVLIGMGEGLIRFVPWREFADGQAVWLEWGFSYGVVCVGLGLWAGAVGPVAGLVLLVMALCGAGMSLGTKLGWWWLQREFYRARVARARLIEAETGVGDGE